LPSHLQNRIRQKRPALRLIVSSATIDAAAFLEYFSSGSPLDDVMIASLEGRMYPVEVAYLREPTSDYVRTAAEVVSNIHMRVGSSWLSLRSGALMFVVSGWSG
jgi:ATP-dependent RNA helicase DDX35